MSKRFFQVLTTMLTVGTLVLSGANAGTLGGSCLKSVSCNDNDKTNGETSKCGNCCGCIDLCCDDSSFELGAELFYGTVCRDTTHTHVKGVAAADVDSTLSAEYDWSVGFQINGDYNFCGCNGLNVGFNYTYFSVDATQSQLINSAIAEHETLAEGVAFESIDDTTSLGFKSTFDYNTFDFDIGYNCCLCKGLQVRPFTGLRVLSTKESYTQSYTVTDPKANKGKIKFQAYGLHSGAEWSVTTSCGLNFFGNVGGSVVAGELTQETQRILFAPGTAPAVEQEFTTKETCHVACGLDTEVGLAYQYEMCDTCLDFTVSYQFSCWDDLGSQFSGHYDSGAAKHTTNGPSKGLLVHGINVGFAVNF